MWRIIMKRFHVHVAVNELAQSVRFYSSLFGQAPSVEKPDYAKWMLEDPRVNFAISKRGAPAGVEHLGFQVDSIDELNALTTQARAANLSVHDEMAATCCYANSDKGWIHDPQGIAWEAFVTHGEATTYSGTSAQDNACCTPQAVAVPAIISRAKPHATNEKACCGS
jgi:catechol 2,3-dioxygenase-like lactoylglutathione lyase family enzyme